MHSILLQFPSAERKFQYIFFSLFSRSTDNTKWLYAAVQICNRLRLDGVIRSVSTEIHGYRLTHVDRSETKIARNFYFTHGRFIICTNKALASLGSFCRSNRHSSRLQSRSAFCFPFDAPFDAATRVHRGALGTHTFREKPIRERAMHLKPSGRNRYASVQYLVVEGRLSAISLRTFRFPSVFACFAFSAFRAAHVVREVMQIFELIASLH